MDYDSLLTDWDHPDMKHTPLIEAHKSAGAKLVDFAGWEMPIQYSGVIDEYQAVRQQAGLFDVSHMGRIEVEGPEAWRFLQRVTTNDVRKIEIGAAQYSMVCNPQGGIKDDIFVYRLAPERFFLCVNASNLEKIWMWLNTQNRLTAGTCVLTDRSSELAQLALQGQASLDIMRTLVGSQVDKLKLRWSQDISLPMGKCLIARTGYTGEFGYELYVPKLQAREVWEVLLKAGAAHGLKPVGLGARDLLRLDMGYFLYGNDLTEETTPIEAGAEWVVNFEKGSFIGDNILKEQVEQGTNQRLVGFELLEKAVPRHGMRVLSNDEEIGRVASGNLSPILQKGIGLAYVIPSHANIGNGFEVEVRNRRVPATVVKPPFYKKSKKTN